MTPDERLAGLRADLHAAQRAGRPDVAAKVARLLTEALKSQDSQPAAASQQLRNWAKGVGLGSPQSRRASR